MIPNVAHDTAVMYPGIASLPIDVQGALLSLVYDRGTSFAGEKRLEMKNIQKWVSQKNLSKIAYEIRSMKRLYQDNPEKIARREAEALMVDKAKYYGATKDYILV